MPETPERRSALAGVYEVGTFGAESPDGPGLVLAERHPLTIIHLAGDPGDGAFLDAVAGYLGAPPPVDPNTVAEGTDCSILWLAPSRWLAVSSRRPAQGFEDGLLAALGEVPAAVTDVSNGRTAIRVSGRAARGLFAKGCPLDFHARRFRPGDCAQSSLGQIATLFHAVGNDRIDIYFARGFAVSLWVWLTDAAAEFGFRVTERLG